METKQSETSPNKKIRPQIARKHNPPSDGYVDLSDSNSLHTKEIQELNAAQQQQFLNIVQDTKSSYDQMCQRLNSWLDMQQIGVQQAAQRYFNNYKKAMDLVDQQIPQLESNLSPMAKQYTEQIESIENYVSNDAYFNHIRQEYDSLPPAIKEELSRFSEQVKSLEDRIFAEYINRAKRHVHRNYV